MIGTGIIPVGAAANELTAVTRRGFLHSLIVQIYNSSPFIAALMSSAQFASGGVSAVSVPVQGAPFVNAQNTDYSGSFNQPSAQQGAFLAEYNLKGFVVPIPFLGMEAAVQIDYAVIPLIEARMNDAGNAMTDLMATQAYSNTTNNLGMIGLNGAIDDGTNLVTYGNINRNTSAYWKSKVYSAGSVNPTRQNVAQYINGVTKSAGEIPTFGLMGFGTWSLLQQDFIGQESYIITPSSSFDAETGGPRAAFTALKVSGVPIYPDPYCPEGFLYLPNARYLNLYLHQGASFAFSGFESTLSNFQLGYIGILLTIAELVCTKPKAMGRVGSYNSLVI